MVASGDTSASPNATDVSPERRALFALMHPSRRRGSVGNELASSVATAPVLRRALSPDELIASTHTTPDTAVTARVDLAFRSPAHFTRRIGGSGLPLPSVRSSAELSSSSPHHSGLAQLRRLPRRRSSVGGPANAVGDATDDWVARVVMGNSPSASPATSARNAMRVVSFHRSAANATPHANNSAVAGVSGGNLILASSGGYGTRAAAADGCADADLDDDEAHGASSACSSEDERDALSAVFCIGATYSGFDGASERRRLASLSQIQRRQSRAALRQVFGTESALDVLSNSGAIALAMSGGADGDAMMVLSPAFSARFDALAPTPGDRSPRAAAPAPQDPVSPHCPSGNAAAIRAAAARSAFDASPSPTGSALAATVGMVAPSERAVSTSAAPHKSDGNAAALHRTAPAEDPAGAPAFIQALVDASAPPVAVLRPSSPNTVLPGDAFSGSPGPAPASPPPGSSAQDKRRMSIVTSASHPVLAPSSSRAASLIAGLDALATPGAGDDAETSPSPSAMRMGHDEESGSVRSLPPVFWMDEDDEESVAQGASRAGSENLVLSRRGGGGKSSIVQEALEAPPFKLHGFDGTSSLTQKAAWVMALVGIVLQAMVLMPMATAGERAGAITFLVVVNVFSIGALFVATLAPNFIAGSATDIAAHAVPAAVLFARCVSTDDEVSMKPLDPFFASQAGPMSTGDVPSGKLDLALSNSGPLDGIGGILSPALSRSPSNMPGSFGAPPPGAGLGSAGASSGGTPGDQPRAAPSRQRVVQVLEVTESLPPLDAEIAPTPTGDAVPAQPPTPASPQPIAVFRAMSDSGSARGMRMLRHHSSGTTGSMGGPRRMSLRHIPSPVQAAQAGSKGSTPIGLNSVGHHSTVIVDIGMNPLSPARPGTTFPIVIGSPTHDASAPSPPRLPPWQHLQRCMGMCNGATTLEQEPPSRWCRYCRRYVAASSKHCRQCARCCDAFDHHCEYLNQCIGAANYTPFVAAVGSWFLLTTLMLVASAALTAVFFQDHGSFESRVRGGYWGSGLFRYTPFDGAVESAAAACGSEITSTGLDVLAFDATQPVFLSTGSPSCATLISQELKHAAVIAADGLLNPSGAMLQVRHSSATAAVIATFLIISDILALLAWAMIAALVGAHLMLNARALTTYEFFMQRAASREAAKEAAEIIVVV